MNDNLQRLMKELRLSGMGSSIEIRLQEARANNLDYDEFLELALEDEMKASDLFLWFRVFGELGQKYRRKEWNHVSALFRKSGELILKLCERALEYDGGGCSGFLEKIADTEEEAYISLV
jgi:hypothetical protein